jgi:tetratricopeptide (TPR) repeat protein
MRWSVAVTVLVMAAAVASGAGFERQLSQDRPSDRAILNYLALIKAGKASSMDLGNLGVLLLDKGYLADAEHYLRAGLKTDKHNFEVAYRLGIVLQREGKDRKATHYYLRALDEQPAYAQARFMLAFAEERCGRRADAIRDYASAYHLAPELANPAVNPLVLESRLQTEAQLAHYRRDIATSTLKPAAPDPAGLRRMLEATPKPVEAAPPTPAAPPLAVAPRAPVVTPPPPTLTPTPTPTAGKASPPQLPVRKP